MSKVPGSNEMRDKQTHDTSRGHLLGVLIMTQGKKAFWSKTLLLNFFYSGLIGLKSLEKQYLQIEIFSHVMIIDFIW